MNNLKIPMKKISLTIPQVYDESLTYYEALSKIAYLLSNLSAYLFINSEYDETNKQLTLSIGVNPDGSTEVTQ